MLASARERHPAQSVGQIGLLSSPFRPGGGGEGLGERGGNEQDLEVSAISPRKALNDFLAASLYRACATNYKKCSNSCAATPTVNPPGGKRGSTARWGRVLKRDEFVREPPSFKVTFNTTVAGLVSQKRHPTR